MIRRKVLTRLFAVGAVFTAAAFVQPAVGASPPADAPVELPPAGTDSIQAYAGTVSAAQLAVLHDLGIDREDLAIGAGTADGVEVEVVMSGRQAATVAAAGIDLVLKAAAADPAARTPQAAAVGDGVYRPYSGPGGIRKEVEQLAADHPDIAKLVTIGKSVNGQPIVGVKITKKARKTKDGARPAVLYIGTVHAREWISPEVTRRLMHLVVDGYATDPSIKELVDTRELWFVPVANPDGYDWTFQEGQRLWRKNLRDNDGDGVITPNDGVDLNRNFSTKWGYDDEGSSPDTGNATYRGPSPLSEPEDKALDALFKRIGFEFTISYHSAAELLLYGTGWQVATPSPDDYIYEALAGDDANPAVPGYDPDISAELYTTNGELTEHASSKYGVLGFTPELSTCETVSAIDATDQWEPDACDSVFNFPDDEALIEAEFQKNIPFALSLAKSAADPANPVSALGLTTPDFVPDTFDVSYGSSQTVAVDVKREVKSLKLLYRINGGGWRSTSTSEWKGGERYGDTGDTWFAERRGTVRGTKVGDSVEVKFAGTTTRGTSKRSSRVESVSFTYTVASTSRAEVLIVANEAYTGVNPVQAGVTAPVYTSAYAEALDANDIDYEIWNVDAQGVPHDLGVLSHFDAVIWELGDSRLAQEPDDEITDTPFGPLPDFAVAEQQQDLTIAVRDFLNEGGKLIYTGETTGYFGLFGGVLGGIYYGLNGDPTADCVVNVDFFSECLILSDDFLQYYLGAFGRSVQANPAAVQAILGPLAGQQAAFGGPALAANPLDEAGAFTLTSEVLPQFEGAIAAEYLSADGSTPYGPVEGAWYAATLHNDDAYQRLTRAVDLSAAAGPAALEFKMSYSTEPGYDSVIIEAHNLTTDTWTTLPDVNGGTTSDVPAECEVGFLLDEHPFLTNYLTLGTPCTAGGAAGGEWHAFTGDSAGWTDVAVDLSAFAGSTVEVSISYVTDPSGGGVGVFVDDTRLIVDGVTTAEGFEGGTLGAWIAGGPPAGSPPAGGQFVASQQLVQVGAVIVTSDSALLGFGIERLNDPAARAVIVGELIRSLTTAP